MRMKWRVDCVCGDEVFLLMIDRAVAVQMCWWGWWGVGLLREVEVVTKGSCIAHCDNSCRLILFAIMFYDIFHTPLLFRLFIHTTSRPTRSDIGVKWLSDPCLSTIPPTQSCS